MNSAADLNWFEASGVARLEPQRKNAEWVASSLSDPNTLFAPVWRSRNLTKGANAALLTQVEVHKIAAHIRETILLGEVDGQVVFAVDCDMQVESLPDACAAHGTFSDLREMAGTLDRDSAGWLAHARAMAHWHKTHGFCGICGAATQSHEAGHVRTCTNPECARSHFPRTDSAVIVLVEHAGRCLLGCNASWTNGLYSTLAGFVEPGESLEDTVRREVAEESGVQVGAVRYHSSQPWPFPASVMLGFFADALSSEISIDEREIADARWFSRDELVAAASDGSIRLPRDISIARRLVNDWYAECGASLVDALAASHN